MSGYAPQTLTHAKRLRRELTDAERHLWRELRGARFGQKWRRQQPIGRYIVDFVCQQMRLIVEVDGGQHCESDADRVRTEWLEGVGYRVVRFWNHEVLEDMEGVMVRIGEAITSAPSPTSPRQQAAKAAYPLPRGERIEFSGSSPLEGEDSVARPRSGLAQLGEGA